MLVLIFLLIITGIPGAIVTLPLMQYLKEQKILPSWIPLPPSPEQLKNHWVVK